MKLANCLLIQGIMDPIFQVDIPPNSLVMETAYHKRTLVKHVLLVGGFNPSEKYESQLGLLFPIYGKIKFMFQTTNQLESDLQAATVLADKALRLSVGKNRTAMFGPWGLPSVV